MNEARRAYAKKYEKERRANDPEYAERRRAYKREYMRKFYARKKHDKKWLARTNEVKRAYRINRPDAERAAKLRNAGHKRWYDKYGKEWRREYVKRKGVKERERQQAAARRRDPAFRAIYLEKKRAYSKTPQYRERRKLWARKYRKTESGARAEFRGRLKTYGITLDDYERMAAEQNGVCAICKQARFTKQYPRLCVDHCHATGRVRGLLCSWCNSLIGHAGDNRTVLMAAVEYLK